MAAARAHSVDWASACAPLKGPDSQVGLPHGVSTGQPSSPGWPTSTDSAMEASLDGSTLYTAESSDGGELRWDEELASVGTDDGDTANGLLTKLQRAQNECDAWQRHAERLAKRLTVERWARAGCTSIGDPECAHEFDRRRSHQHEDEAAEHASDVRRSDARASDTGRPALIAPQARRLPENPAAKLLRDEFVERCASAPPALPDFSWPGRSCAQISALISRGAAGGWIVAPNELQMGPLLGNGAFGATYRARWHGADVAVKRVRIESDVELASFLREVECLSGLRHPGIIPFLGAVVKDEEHCWLVSEYMPGGSLEGMLHGQKAATNWRLSDGLERAAEIGAALAALASCEPQVLHRDVKPSNVLIDGAGRARLGDFGLARRSAQAGQEGVLTGETGTYLYMAPEVMRHDEYDASADVWSFGVMLSEIATRQKPYHTTFMTPVQIALAVSSGKLRPSVPAYIPVQLSALIARCCDPNPAKRPSMKEATNDLRQAIDTVKSKEGAAPKRSTNPLSTRSLKSFISGISGKHDWQT
ncbi:hypothetical protein Rsub_03530 [Raphidocelis subcapitata]|uniref:Protein kinase domain-containing protein n=1 Tax=Raphidocelis subcapitata TaxID=307507 RepID=A0A2V0NSD3_9CHLO|nr:hypothetical protein Rsub_03530 [Raphidocelis subcapitata]|eukprot:GBF90534.1 hypothetical protein Rsub_03530 [Raphidocelis subcapitata]